jgi:glutathione S-transferase
VVYIVANGIKIGQSAVIERYFARKAGLMGASDEEAALIECLVENVNDIKAAFRKIRDMPAGADKDSAMKTWYTTSLSEWLAKLEKSFPSTSSVDCAVGQKMSYADIALWHMCNDFFKFEDVSDACKSHKKISSIVGKVAANPELKKWLNERPVTMF